MSRNERVLSGTQSWKRHHQRQGEVGIVKASHPASFKKIRCAVCRQGIATEVVTAAGRVYRCGRCKTEFVSTAL